MFYSAFYQQQARGALGQFLSYEEKREYGAKVYGGASAMAALANTDQLEGGKDSVVKSKALRAQLKAVDARYAASAGKKMDSRAKSEIKDEKTSLLLEAIMPKAFIEGDAQ